MEDKTRAILEVVPGQNVISAIMFELLQKLQLDNERTLIKSMKGKQAKLPALPAPVTNIFTTLTIPSNEEWKLCTLEDEDLSLLFLPSAHIRKASFKDKAIKDTWERRLFEIDDEKVYINYAPPPFQ